MSKLFCSLYPHSFEEHIALSAALNNAIIARTQGRCRLGTNRLAAIIAGLLPHAEPGTNVNTLRAMDTVQLVVETQGQPSHTDDTWTRKHRIIETMKAPITLWMQHTMPFLARCLHLNVPAIFQDITRKEGGIYVAPEAYFHEAHLYELNTSDWQDMEILCNSSFPDLLEEAYSRYLDAPKSDTDQTPRMKGMSYHTLRKRTAGYAYQLTVFKLCQRWLADVSLVVQQELKQEIDNMSTEDRLTLLRTAQAHYCLTTALAQGGDTDSLRALLRGKHTVPEFTVPVRAKVRMRSNELADYLVPEPWVSLESSRAENGYVTLDLECFVTCRALNKKAAERFALEQMLRAHPYRHIGGGLILSLTTDDLE